MRGRYNNFEEHDMVSQMRELVRRVEDLEKGAGIGSTSIDSGDLSIRGGSFSVGEVPAVYMGPLGYGADTGTGWQFRREDGTVAFALTGDDIDHQFFELRDSAANVIVADDADANQGMARPYLNIHLHEHGNIVPTITTTSTSFTPLWAARFLKQHPYVQMDILCRASDGSTSGQIQIFNTNTGLVIAGPTNITLGFYDTISLGPAQVAGLHMETIELEIQVKRTAGAGTIGIRPQFAYGVQTP